MALAKVYDSEDTLMVPIDALSAGNLSGSLSDAAKVLQTINGPLFAVTIADLLTLADAVTDARIAAGLTD